MKKLGLFVAFMLTAMVASAQSVVGSWFTNLEDNDKDPLSCTLTLNSDNTLKMAMQSDIKDVEMGVITLEVVVDGTYKLKDKTLKLNFDKNSIDLRISKIKFTPEVQAALDANPALKDQFMGLMEQGLKEGKNVAVEDFPLNGDSEIKELTATKLVLLETDDEIVFTRK